jgi:hypothetical protein
MKTTIKRSIGVASILAAGLATSTVVSAEAFNDRGPLFTDTVSTSAPAPFVTSGRAVASRFNDRGEHFTTVAPRGSQRAPDRVVARIGQGFNDRSNGVISSSGGKRYGFSGARVAQAGFNR